MRAKRIAIFGGSFNPPHVSHQLACAYVLATARPRVDQVWMMPTWKHPFDKQLAPYADRVEMCTRAAEPFAGRVEVSRLEEELATEQASYTLTTVQALKARYPDVELALVIGADLIPERERWHGWATLKTLVEFIVVGRGGYASEGGPLVELPPISSTEVRTRIARGEPVDSLIDAAVLDYIREHRLYLDEAHGDAKAPAR
jgi:nicotinate-nucleotide adenylyltransferase